MEMTHVGNTQGSQVVSLAVLAAAHPVSGSSASGASSERRRDIASLLGPRASSSSSSSSRIVSHPGGNVGRASLGADRGHGVLVRAAGCEMLAVANTTLDLLVLKLVLHGLGVGVLALLLLILAPVRARPEDDVLTDGGRVGGGTGGILGAEAELGPCLALGDARVHLFRVRGVADAASRLHLLALIVVTEGDDGLGAVLVADGLGRGEVGGGLVDIFVVGPVVPGQRERRGRSAFLYTHLT